MSRQVKRMMIDSIQIDLSEVRDLLVVDISRVSAVSVNRIRMNLAEQRIRLKCVKNAVVTRALVDLGISASPMLVGPSAIVFGSDDISTISKEVSKCAELHKEFEIKSGVADGRILSKNDIDILIKSPGKAELLSQLSQQINGPAGCLVSAVSNSYTSIAIQLHQLTTR